MGRPPGWPVLCLALAACGIHPAHDGRTILAVGDSVMAWNGGRGIPETTAAALDRPVRDRARSLARIEQPNPVAARLGFDIARQWSANRGPWSWVILTGGANDLRPHCGTATAGAALDRLIGPDGRGALPDLVADMRAAGARVAYVGYYDGAEGDPTGFTPCQPLFDVLNDRMARLAAADAGMVVLDAGTVIDPGDPGDYASDRVHPSAAGAARIGARLAKAIRAAE